MLSCLGGSRTKRPPKQNPVAGKQLADTNNNINSHTQRSLRNIQHHRCHQQQQPCRPHQPLPHSQNFTTTTTTTATTTAQDAAAYIAGINPQHHLPRIQNLAGPQRPTLVQQQKQISSFTSSPYPPATAAPHSARRVPEQQKRQWQRPMIHPADGSCTALPQNTSNSTSTRNRPVQRRQPGGSSAPSYSSSSSSVVDDSSVIIARPPATARSRAFRRRSSVRSSIFSLCKNMTGLPGSEELGHFSASSSSSEALLGDVIARPARAAAERRSSRTMTVYSNNRGSMFSLCKNLTGLPGSELGFGMGGYHNLDEQKSEVEHESDLSSMRGGATGSGAAGPLTTRRGPNGNAIRTPPRRPPRPDEHITGTGAVSDTDTRGPYSSPTPTTVTTTTTTTMSALATRSKTTTSTAHLRRPVLPLRVNASAHNEQLHPSRETREQARQRLEGSVAPYRHGDENAGFWNTPAADTAAAETSTRRRAEDRITVWPTMPPRPSSPSATGRRQQRQEQGSGSRYQQQTMPPLTDQNLHAAAHYAVSSSNSKHNDYPQYSKGSGRDGYRSLTHYPRETNHAADGRQCLGMDSNGVSPCSSPVIGHNEDYKSGKSWREMHVVSPVSCISRSSSVYST